jgi:hypothetical protein
VGLTGEAYDRLITPDKCGGAFLWAASIHPAGAMPLFEGSGLDPTPGTLNRLEIPFPRIA